MSSHPLKAFALGYFEKLVQLKSTKLSELRSHIAKNSSDWAPMANFFGSYRDLMIEKPEAMRTLFLDFLEMIGSQSVA